MTEPSPGTPSEPPRSRPEERYGAAEAGSGVMGKVVAAALFLLVGALVVAGGITVWRINTTPEVATEVIGVQVIDDGEVGLTFTVARDEPGVPVYCIVRAQDQSKGELGRREVYVPASESGTVQIDTEIATTARAFIADVYGCGEDVPDYLRP